MPNWLETSLTILIGLVMLAGTIGLAVPIFPGLLIIWLASLGYGLLSGFNTTGIVIFILITILALGGSLVDNLLMAIGGHKGGASWKTILVALFFGILGTLLLPPFGGLIAAPLSILLLEYYRVRDWDKARQALIGMAAGWGLSVAARVLIGAVILILWGIWVWRG